MRVFPRLDALDTGLLTLVLVATCGIASAHAQSTIRPNATAAPILVTGTLKINVTVTAGPSVPAGTSLSVTPQITVSDATFTNSAYNYGLTTTVTGGKATFSMTIPYRWNVVSRSDQINVLVNLDGSYAKGSTSTYFSKKIAIPANGTTTTVTLAGSI